MRASHLLALYPRSWRMRYGEEISAILGDERLSVALVVDLILGAVDAHLHPELAGPLLAAAGGGTLLTPRGPRRWLGPFVLILFVAGMAFCYFVLLPQAIKFLISFAGDVIENQLRASTYLSFVTMFIMAMLGLLLVALILALASLLRRGRARDRFAELARIADLRDRGVLTEDEFQREKQKLLQ